MNKIKTIRINYHILLSVLIHLSSLFVEKKRGRLGKKIIPIESIDNFQESGLEATKRSEKSIKRPSIKKN